MGKLTDIEAARIGKALGDPSRLAIYTQISQSNELFCGEICAKHTISAPTVSHHLKVLTELGLIVFRKDGLNMYYRAVPEKFAAFLAFMAEIGPKPGRRV